MQQKPNYWRTTLDDIKQTLDEVSQGTISTLGYSAGNRSIQLVEYGEKEDFYRQANYNSACGAQNVKHYADKSKGQKPVILLIGGIHGAEFEGIAGLMNLMNVIETGKDYRGKQWDFIYENWKKARLLLIPCMNPDGRARVPVDSLVGMEYETFRYYSQGTWKDGSLCEWPQCKAVHPIKEHVDFLGGYYNDDGINMMHDNFFLPMAKETKILMSLVDQEAPDLAVQLHGGGNCTNTFMPIPYLPEKTMDQMMQFDLQWNEACANRELKSKKMKAFNNESERSPSSFNLTSAIHHLCGGISMTYETNQGINYGDHTFVSRGVNFADNVYTHEEILDHHLVLFEQCLAFYLE
ncbi:M14 family zinc carboxypeptidase [Chengkuizengella axinellae]|uniref:M14 family zinc carboxypeptidase n=1 Tax=Chengkuizengella axinellae TaxID=3064388 RepID=A0ABT9IZK4_9BACL|nr:M14 family zinc carboxypeptidase [Chengkuizengella sp. 2205SS18-9]MDP5274792.1 M14 family zinc carboxypeptidase [Chengkuizengella sp. 2205SS18-9]